MWIWILFVEDFSGKIRISGFRVHNEGQLLTEALRVKGR